MEIISTKITKLNIHILILLAKESKMYTIVSEVLELIKVIFKTKAIKFDEFKVQAFN